MLVIISVDLDETTKQLNLSNGKRNEEEGSLQELREDLLY